MTECHREHDPAPGAGPSPARMGFRLLLLLCSCLLSLGLLEAGVRLLSSEGVDDGVHLRSLRLRPYRLPVQYVRTALAEYARTPGSYIQYDPDLGWSIRPLSRSKNGLYFSDAAGIRSLPSRRETLPRPSPDTLRIAILGDSFTHGDSVPYEVTWGAVLEQQLVRRGIRAEVLNLGVGGYGMDQALLRWRKQGAALKPQIVVFGFNRSNVRRNLNIFRVFYQPGSGLVFSKPRFVLEGGSLQLVNAPTIPLEDLPGTLEAFDSWGLKDLEFFYRDVDYAERPIHASRLATLIDTGLATGFSSRRRDYDFFEPGSPAFDLSLRIVEALEREVEASGGRFLIVHIPTRNPIKRLIKGETLKHQALLDELAARYELVDPAPELLREAKSKSYEELFVEGDTHYSALAHRVIGEAVARAVVNL